MTTAADKNAQRQMQEMTLRVSRQAAELAGVQVALDQTTTQLRATTQTLVGVVNAVTAGQTTGDYTAANAQAGGYVAERGLAPGTQIP